jgi:hypothetical protein
MKRLLGIPALAAAAAGISVSLAEPSLAEEAVAPQSIHSPKIFGIPREGQTLTTDGGQWSGTEPISYSFQWRRCDLTKLNCKSIAGATAQSYTLTGSDVGATIRVRAIATNSAGITIDPSMATHPVSPPCPAFGSRQQVGTVGFSNARELSGLASSRRNPGVLWAHNDSGDTERVFAMSQTGTYLGTYNISPNLQSDWEDMAVGPGPDPGVSYLYLGSIGGNKGRRWLSVFRAPEPEVSPSQTPMSAPLQSVAKLSMRYPDGQSHNAEALMVDPRNHDIYVVTKKLDGVAIVYRYPAAEQDPAINYVLQPIATKQLPGPATAADISADGSEIAIKGYTYSQLWPRSVNVPLDSALALPPCSIGHGPGEAFAFAADGSGYFTTSEGLFRPLYWFGRLPAEEPDGAPAP